jgi:V/A-type H+-transporting ATPase subunit E
MTQDLQQLLEKIQRDGVDKAKSDADKLVSEAQAQARKIVEAAHAAAAKIKADARQEAEAFERRAEETVRQSARDTVLNVEKAVTALFGGLLLQDVNAALSSAELTAELAAEAVRAYIGEKGGVEVAAAAKPADALRAKLAAEAASGVTVVTDDTTGAGFRLRLAGGRVEHAFTGAAVADALAKQLRPRLAALMKQP